MDWGLMRGSHPHNRFLRDKLKYPNHFYYFSMVTNLLLRFSWLLMFISSTMYPPNFYNNGGLLFLLALAEAYRRAQWSLFRIENENVNNFEKYRVILDIPNILDDESVY